MLRGGENSIEGLPADLVAAKRRILLADGTSTNLPEHPNHIDTSCYWLLEGAFPVAHWLTMAPQLAPLCDRIFYRIVNANSLTMYCTKSETVNFVGNYANFYRAVGKRPPPDAKTIDWVSIINWIRSLDSRQQRLASARPRLAGCATSRSCHRSSCSGPTLSRVTPACPIMLRRTETPARYISIRASSTELSRRR
jgi:hypothetical protein